jgi:hypothetical protein
VASEGHRQGEAGIHARTAVARWRHRAWPCAALICVRTAKEGTQPSSYHHKADVLGVTLWEAEVHQYRHGTVVCLWTVSCCITMLVLVRCRARVTCDV